MAVCGLSDGVSTVDLLSFACHRLQLGRVLIGPFILYPGDEVIGELRARVCVCAVGAAGGSCRVRVAPSAESQPGHRLGSQPWRVQARGVAWPSSRQKGPWACGSKLPMGTAILWKLGIAAFLPHCVLKPR